MDAICRQGHAFGDRDANAVDVDIDGRRGFDRVLDAFHAHPAAAVAGQGPADHAVVQDLLHACRAQHRDHRIDHRELALVAGRGRFAGVVVAHQDDHAAQPGRAGQIAVAKRVARAIDSRPLAVPEREYAVVFALAADLSLLRAPDGGGGQVFVHARHEDHVVRVEVLPGLLDLIVVGSQRRAAVAADVASRVVTCRWSRCCWVISRRTSAWVPVMKILPVVSVYLSSSVTGFRVMVIASREVPVIARAGFGRRVGGDFSG